MKNRIPLLSMLIIIIQSVQCVWAAEKEFSINIPQGKLTVIPLSQEAVRFRLTHNTSQQVEELVYLDNNKKVNFSTSKNGDIHTLKLNSVHVIVSEKSGDIKVNNKGVTIFSSKSIELRDHKAELSFYSPQDEVLNGLGEFQDGYLNVRGLSRRLTQVNTQISVPMIISSRGYGIMWNNYGLTDFNPCSNSVELRRDDATAKKETVNQTTSLGNEKAEILSNLFKGEIVIKEDGEYSLLLDMGQKMAHAHNLIIDSDTIIDMHNIWLPPTTSKIVYLKKGIHKISSLSDKNDSPKLYFDKVGDRTTLSSPVAECVDFTLYIGEPERVIAAYRELTGEAPMIPLWALGYIHCRERFHSQDEILTTASTFRKKGYPIDMIVQDWQWWGDNGWNAMKFDSKNYPDPKLLVDRLHENNIRLMLSVWSKIDATSQVGKEMAAKGYYIPNTTWIDFFNPEAAKAYWENFSSRLLKPYGIDAWWQDATEPENDDLQGRVVCNGSKSGDIYRNIYPLFVNKTVYEGSLRDVPNKRAMILTRCGFSGLQRYGAAVWSGDVGNDFETLRRQITAGLGLVSTGLPWWTFDAGGFFRPADQYTSKSYRERFVRWLQVSTFLPLMRVHGYMSNTEFWNYGDDVERIAHKYLELRYSMMPYIYTQASRVSYDGSNILRPLMMNFSHDKRALQQKYEYMFGPSILVAPVVEEGAKEWSIYLPDNKKGWTDFWNGKRYDGAQQITKEVSLEDIPLFIQKGTILTLAGKMNSTVELNSVPLEIRIYPGADASTEIYNDNGADMGYKKGETSRIKMRWNDKKRELTIAEREGQFNGMAKSIKMSVTIVDENSNDETKKDITYCGEETKIKL